MLNSTLLVMLSCSPLELLSNHSSPSLTASTARPTDTLHLSFPFAISTPEQPTTPFNNHVECLTAAQTFAPLQCTQPGTIVVLHCRPASKLTVTHTHVETGALWAPFIRAQDPPQFLTRSCCPMHFGVPAGSTLARAPCFIGVTSLK